MYNIIRGIIEAGNCVFCGKHIDDNGSVFLCEKCRRKEEERCPHERPKVAGTNTARPERPTTAKEPRRKPTGKEER